MPDVVTLKIYPTIDVIHDEQQERCKAHLPFVPRRQVGILGEFQNLKEGEKSRVTEKRVVVCMSIAEGV